MKVDASLPCPKASDIQATLDRQLEGGPPSGRGVPDHFTVRVEPTSGDGVRVIVEVAGTTQLVRTLKNAGGTCDALSEAIGLIVVTWIRQPPPSPAMSFAQSKPRTDPIPVADKGPTDSASSTTQVNSAKSASSEHRVTSSPEPKPAEPQAQSPSVIEPPTPSVSVPVAGEQHARSVLRFSLIGLGGADWMLATGSLSPFVSIRPELLIKDRFGVSLQLSWEKGLTSEVPPGSVDSSILWAALFGKLVFHPPGRSGLELLAGARLDRVEARSQGYALTSSSTVLLPSGVASVEWRQFFGKRFFLQAGVMACLRPHGQGFTISGLGRVLLIPPLSTAISVGSGVEL